MAFSQSQAGDPGPRVTRLAPSPTGALHLGNARTFLINWALARQHGWKIVLRIEDLDTPRIKSGADQMAIDDLRWLGLDWDGPPHDQRADLAPYHEALLVLRERGLVYPCRCTRKEIEQAQSAPHEDGHELRYPGTCRPTGHARALTQAASHAHGPGAGPVPPAMAATPSSAQPDLLDSDDQIAWRLLVPDEPVRIEDAVAGTHEINVQRLTGDFVVATKAGLPAYQLAVVVDDARQGVTDVVRGDDLLTSAARQVWLYRLLGLAPLPRYWHLPLVVGPDGRRLAKRHGDTRLSWYREQGVPAERMVAKLAQWSGIEGVGGAMTAETFAQRFRLDRLPRHPVTFTPDDHAWLLCQ